jgi:predicted Zn-dependent protease
MQKAQEANIGVTLACVLTSVCNNQATGAAIDVAGGALFAKFSRDDEAEADAEGVKNVVRAGIDPRGIPELFQILIRARERAPSQLEAFFASHPLEESRIAATQQQIANLGRAKLATLTADDASFHEFKNALAALPPPSARLPRHSEER